MPRSATSGYDVVHNHAFDAPGDHVRGRRRSSRPAHPAPPARARRRRRAGRGAPARSAAHGRVRFRKPGSRLAGPTSRSRHCCRRYIPTRSIPFGEAAAPGAVFAGRLSPEKGAVEAIEIARAAGLRSTSSATVYDARYAREHDRPAPRPPGVAIHRASREARSGRPWRARAVVLCPARWEEPFGMVAAEAQACGTPVVAFARGALAEVIVDRVTGFLVAPDDTDGAAADAVHGVRGAFARAVPATRRKRARPRARTLDAHEQLYERLAAARREVRGPWLRRPIGLRDASRSSPAPAAGSAPPPRRRSPRPARASSSPHATARR